MNTSRYERDEDMKKFELVKDFALDWEGRKLYRIIACKNFRTRLGEVKIGDTGGWVESEENLSQDGNAWIYRDAAVYGGASVHDNAVVGGEVNVCGNIELHGETFLHGNDDIRVCGDSK